MKFYLKKSKIKDFLKVVLCIVLSFGCFMTTCYGVTRSKGYREKLDSSFFTKEYVNEKYNVSFYYHESWIKDPKYYERYSGNNGFFQVAASTGKNTDIDELAYNIAHEKFLPFGINPVISNVIVDNREGRLIMPSDDQNKDYENAAQLIVKYDKPITIGDEKYYFFILYSDKVSINYIIKTIKFI